MLDQPLENDQKSSGDNKIQRKKLDTEQVINLIRDSDKYLSSYTPRWDEYFKCYKGERVQRVYDGQTDIVVREAHSIVETIVANIASGIPEAKYVPTSPEQTRDTDILNNYARWVLIQNRFGVKQQSWIRDMTLYGNGFLHVGVGDNQGTPKIDNVAVRDIIMDPNSTDITNAKYMGHKYMTEYADLESATIYSVEKDQWVKKYKNLSRVKAEAVKASKGKDKTDKQFKDQFNKSLLGEEAIKRQVVVSRIYHLPTAMVYEVANGTTLIYAGPTPYQRAEITKEVAGVGAEGEPITVTKKLSAIKPFLPYAPARNLIDSSQFLAEGDMAVIFGDSELLSDLVSMDVDNAMLINTPMWQIDPGFSDLAPEIEAVSGAVYPVPKGALSPLERPNIGAELASKIAMTERRMRKDTAADQAVQGASQSKSRTTATEISSQLMKAQDRFGTKITNLEAEGFAQLFQIIHKIMQIFVTQETVIKVVGPNGIAFKDYDPYEYDGEFDVNVLLDTTLKQQQLEVGQKNNQIYQLLADDPQGIFNPVEIKRWMLKKVDPTLTDDDFNAMLRPPAPPTDDAPSKEYINIDYKDASPWVKYQLEKKLGLEPDPAHLADMEVKMATQANQMSDLANPLTDANNNPINLGEPNNE